MTCGRRQTLKEKFTVLDVVTRCFYRVGVDRYHVTLDQVMPEGIFDQPGRVFGL